MAQRTLSHAGGLAADAAGGRRRAWGLRDVLDKSGIIVALIALAGLSQPFMSLRANRIVDGEGIGLPSILGANGLALAAGLSVVAAFAIFRAPPRLRLAVSLASLLVLVLAAGFAAGAAIPAGNSVARVSPAAGFWLLFTAFAMMLADAAARSALTVLARLGLVALISAIVVALALAGVWNEMSVMREYAVRADAFWRESRTHLALALGSMLAAVALGAPLGILAHRQPWLRAFLLNGLNIIQTVPSIALFGLLIAPLGWVAANVPGAAGLGIAGIGFAPAFVALVAYALLPMVANTVAGLASVPPLVVEASRAMGMTPRQRLMRVDLPLAFPVLLAGIRIVLVQNIGLATIAALIGGGGLGTFVFQGISQTAMDLVLLGAVPTVLLALVSALVLDALVDLSRRGVQGSAG